jgi:hypothetical protein
VHPETDNVAAFVPFEHTAARPPVTTLAPFRNARSNGSFREISNAGEMAEVGAWPTACGCRPRWRKSALSCVRRLKRVSVHPENTLPVSDLDDIGSIGVAHSLMTDHPRSGRGKALRTIGSHQRRATFPASAAAAGAAWAMCRAASLGFVAGLFVGVEGASSARVHARNKGDGEESPWRGLSTLRAVAVFCRPCHGADRRERSAARALIVVDRHEPCPRDRAQEACRSTHQDAFSGRPSRA